jgi:hypothetical protein
VALGIVETVARAATTSGAPDGGRFAAPLANLSRNIGAAVGVSVTSSMLATNAPALHGTVGGTVNPFNRAFQALTPLNSAARSGDAVLQPTFQRLPIPGLDGSATSSGSTFCIGVGRPLSAASSLLACALPHPLGLRRQSPDQQWVRELP